MRIKNDIEMRTKNDLEAFYISYHNYTNKFFNMLLYYFQFDNITYKDVIMLSISVIVSVTMFIVVNIENKMK